MYCVSHLPNSVTQDFRDRVHHECQKAAINGEPITYQDIAEAVIGDADRGTRDRRFIRLVDKAMCDNMKDDREANRPFSAVAVRRVDIGVPGTDFFTQAWKLGRFLKNDDPVEFVKQEWASYCQSLSVVSNAHRSAPAFDA